MATCSQTGKQCPQTNQGKKGCQHWLVFEVGRPAKLMGDCAFNWQAVFLYDLRRDTNGVQQAVESFRNTVTEQQRRINGKGQLHLPTNPL